MVFNSIKETLWTRRSRSRTTSNLPIPQNELPTERDDRAEKLQETMNVFSRLGHSVSSRNIKLPPIPSFKPLNFSGLDIFKSKNDSIETVPVEIRRKPCPIHQERFGTLPGTSTDMLDEQFQVFDPGAPVTDRSLHRRAREALKRRYQSKFTIDFTPPLGVDVREYDFIWCDEEELDLKVLRDIIWVRERFAKAKRGEPSDECIIHWYDAEKFDPEAPSNTASSLKSYYL